MIRLALLAAVTLCLVSAPALAAEKTADYEVHEWGFVTINAPPDQHSVQNYLENLPGNVRKPEELVMIEQRPAAPGDGVQIQPGQGGPQNPGGSGSGQGGFNGAGAGGAPGSSSGQGSPGWTGWSGTPGSTGAMTSTEMARYFCDPFIWFHANRPVNIKVTVKLGKAVPVCWWPQGRNDETTLIWDRVSLRKAPHGGKRLPEKGERDSEFWNNVRSGRNVDSSYVCTGNKVEKFLMYEFAGSFQTGLRVARTGGGFTISNNGFFPTQDILLVSGGKVFSAATLNPGQSSSAGSIRDLGEFKTESFLAVLAEALVKAGLNADEAAAMGGIMSMQRAFFASAGVKAVYILSQRQVDEIAKLELSPEPSLVKRVWLALVWDAENVKGEEQAR